MDLKENMDLVFRVWEAALKCIVISIIRAVIKAAVF